MSKADNKISFSRINKVSLHCKATGHCAGQILTSLCLELVKEKLIAGEGGGGSSSEVFTGDTDGNLLMSTDCEFSEL